MYIQCTLLSHNVFIFRGIVHICHGLHEYTGRYELFAQQLKDNGFLVRGIDLGE